MDLRKWSLLHVPQQGFIENFGPYYDFGGVEVGHHAMPAPANPPLKSAAARRPDYKFPRGLEGGVSAVPQRCSSKAHM